MSSRDETFSVREISARPKIVGIVNLTEDSFFDGGRYLDADAASSHARNLLEQGADVIELGPASSHPEAVEVDSNEEIRRLAPVLAALAERGVLVSIDSWHPQTQRFCAQRGAAFLNDIRGFSDPTVYAFLRDADCRLVIMHSLRAASRATREEAEADAVVGSMFRFFERRIAELECAGVARTRLVLDPGMGLFLGRNPEPSLEVLRRLGELRRRFALPVMVSVSRKSFLGAVTGRSLEERGPATLAAELWAAAQGVDFIRTHDVGALRDALAVLAAITAGRPVDLD